MLKLVLLHLIGPCCDALLLEYMSSVSAKPEVGRYCIYMLATACVFAANSVCWIAKRSVLRSTADSEYSKWLVTRNKYSGYHVAHLLGGSDINSYLSAKYMLIGNVGNVIMMTLPVIRHVAKKSISNACIVITIIAAATVIAWYIIGLVQSIASQMDHLRRVRDVRYDELNLAARHSCAQREYAAVHAISAEISANQIKSAILGRIPVLILFSAMCVVCCAVSRDYIASGKYAELMVIAGEFMCISFNINGAINDYTGYVTEYSTTITGMAEICKFPASIAPVDPAPDFDLPLSVVYEHEGRDGKMITYFNLNVTIERGITVLIGSEGSGKTTFTRMFSDELDHSGLCSNISPSLLRQHSLMLPQRTTMPDKAMTATEYFGEDRVDAAICVATRLGFGKLFALGRDTKVHGDKTHGLSGGQGRLMAVFKVLCDIPDHVVFLILDEPDTGLSPKSARTLYDAISREFSHLRILYITHHERIQELAERRITFA